VTAAYPHTPADLAARALDVDAVNLALGHETFEAGGARFVRNRSFPRIYDANHVNHVTADTPEAINHLLARVELEYEGYDHREFGVDYRTPPAFVSRLALEGYERRDSLVMLLEGDLAGDPPEHDIRSLDTEDGWCAYDELHAIDWKEHMERVKRTEDPSVPEQMRATHRAKQPPVQYFLAYSEGRPVAYFNSWAGIDGVGQVEDLFTHPDFRHRGFATALIHHCVADARSKGAGPVVIVADPDDTPKRMYAALGFRPVAVYSHYLKRLHQDG
jgi:ribosomal protein S18 acetylase RimI-like enzyme